MVKVIDMDLVFSSFSGDAEQLKNIIYAKNTLAAFFLHRNDCDKWKVDVKGLKGSDEERSSTQGNPQPPDQYKTEALNEWMT